MTNPIVRTLLPAPATKALLAGALVLGALAGTPAVADAASFHFSWQTPQGTYILGPNGTHFRPHWQAPRHLHRPHHVQPARYQIRPRQARRILRQAGFRDISYLRERRNVYVFEARGQRGYRRIAVNKFTGAIIWRWGRH